MHKLAELEAQCSLLVEKMRKFNAIDYEMMNTMFTLKKENEDIKMDLIKCSVREKMLIFALLFSWAVFALMFSAMYMY